VARARVELVNYIVLKKIRLAANLGVRSFAALNRSIFFKILINEALAVLQTVVKIQRAYR
jgi:hypothetical protein